MKSVGTVLLAVLMMALGACTVKEEKTVQQPAASAAPTASGPAGTTTSKTYSLF